MSFYVEKVKRKKGSVYRIVKDVTRNGKRTRSYDTLPIGTTKAMAEKICHQMALESEYGEYVQKKSLLFQEYVEEIYFPKYTQYLSVTTQQNYRQIYYAPDGMKANLGEYELKAITVEILQELVNKYSEDKAPKTIRNFMSFVSVVLKQAMNDNYLKRQEINPCTFLRFPKPKGQEGNAYTMEEVKILLERAKNAKNHNMELLIAICCLAGGLRRSELIGLKWSDIILSEESSYICVQRAVVQTKAGVFEKETKTKAGKRVVPIAVNGTVYNVLTRIRREYLKKQLSVKDFQGNDQLFIRWEVSPCFVLTPNQLYNEFQKFLKKECPDLPRYRLHDLRHTYFTLCSNIEGFSELSIIGTGGHSTILSTKRYQHPMMEKMLVDMEKLEESFEKIPLTKNA